MVQLAVARVSIGALLTFGIAEFVGRGDEETTGDYPDVECTRS